MGLSPEKMWCVYSWSRYVVTYNLRSNLLGFWHGFVFGPHLFLSIDIAILYLAHECITMDNPSHTIMTSVWPWPVVSISIYIFTMIFYMDKIVFALWHRRTKFSTSLNHQETACCVHSWPVYDLWPMWVEGVSLERLTHNFYLVILAVN